MDLHHPSADEREIRSLSNRSGVEVGQVRVLFRDELARLGMGAKVGSYLAVLTTANVRGMLLRAARRRKIPRHLHRWEDDGGSAREDAR